MAVTIDGTNGVSGPINVTTDSVKLDGNYPVGTNNVALGDNTFASLDSCDGNTAIGSNALYSNTTGTYNVAVGYQAVDANTTGVSNVGIGVNALTSNSTGTDNTAVGRDSLQNNTTANNNTAVGRSALAANTTGAQNTAIGRLAGTSNTTGTGNSFLGHAAGQYVTTGSNNTIIGRFDGNQGGLDIRTASNRIVLSDGDGNIRASHNASRWRFATNQTGTASWDQNTAGQGHYLDIGGTYPIGACSENRIVCILNRYQGSGTVVEIKNGTGVVGTISHNGSTTSYNTSSDYRLKENVVDLTGAIDRVKQLKPSQFNFIADPDRTVDGFLAHEAAEVVPEAVTGEKDAVDADGNPEYQGIDQSKLVPLLTAALKDAITEIESLKARVTALESN